MLSTTERLTKARIQIQMKNPFFAHMSLYLNFKEMKKGELDCDSMGVDVKGTLYYYGGFVEKLSDEELKGVLIHEILHLTFLHLTRLGTRNHEIFNIATDLCINWLISQNGFTLPSSDEFKPLVPDYDGEFNEMGLHLEKINEKTAEIVYDEIVKQAKKNGENAEGEGDEGGEGEGDVDLDKLGKARFDEHKYSKEMTKKEKDKAEKQWVDRIQEGMTIAKMKGDVPNGMERFLGDLHKEKINWKSLLNQYITQQIPYDYSYAKPHKKSVCVGTYMPHQLKEKVEIAVCIDLSGSIGAKEYADFMSEIVGLARAYQERIDIHFYSHDTEGYYGGLVQNGNIHKILALDLKGGGGTSHKPVMDLMKENNETKMVVFFTDGYSDLDEINFGDYPYEKVFVIVNGTDEQLKDKKCKIINMEKD